MGKIRILQANVGRGREATEAVKRMAHERRADVICVTEPYHNLRVWNELGIWYGTEDAKTGVVIVKGIREVCEAGEGSSRNNVFVKTRRGGEEIIAASVYAEKNGCLESQLREIETVVRGTNSGVVITGDFNAQNVVWGGDTTDNRGRRLLDWVTTNSLIVLNNADDLPTFDNGRGRSWIDITITNGAVAWGDWYVIEEDTLSDHRAV